MKYFDTAIIGGGLAGLTAAIHLSKLKYNVLLIEKHSYPNLGAASINTVQLSTIRGKSTTVSLPLGGIGISRYAFDKLLFDHAVKAGVNFVFDTVTDIHFQNNIFTTEHMEIMEKGTTQVELL